ncbi:hypothetical protein B1790_15520 [Mycobacterium sp. AT1]|nr:hypothetical protein B1790_15520 [Mycobacterium sp. AT1]
MTVYFIGGTAGMLTRCPAGATLVNTARMPLSDVVDDIALARAAGHDVARLHSGDLSVYSTPAGQLRELERHGID